MRGFFQKFTQYALLRAALLAVLGILMLLFPGTLLNLIVYIVAACVIIYGVVNIINYIRTRTTAVNGFEFVVGCLLLVLGLVMILFSRQIVSILPIFLGVLLVIGGASYFVNAWGAGEQKNIPLLLLSALIIIGGLLVIFNPFGSMELLCRIFGLLLLLSCVDELFAFFTYRNGGK